MTPRRRTTFDKLQRERARRDKQAEKRARRLAKGTEQATDPEAVPGQRVDTTTREGNEQG